MTKTAILERRRAAAARAVARRWRQDYIDENVNKPGKYEGMYVRPKLITRRVKIDG